eukprot:134577-Amphidinium_carterae.3
MALTLKPEVSGRRNCTWKGAEEYPISPSSDIGARWLSKDREKVQLVGMCRCPDPLIFLVSHFQDMCNGYDSQTAATQALSCELPSSHACPAQSSFLVKVMADTLQSWMHDSTQTVVLFDTREVPENIVTSQCNSWVPGP